MASGSVRQNARKWLASLLSDSVTAASSSSSSSVSSSALGGSSGSIAKERLQIILAHQRGSQVLAGVDLAKLQHELLQCVQRHIQVANEANINIAVKHEGTLDIFEMQVPVDGTVVNHASATSTSRASSTSPAASSQ